MDPLSQGVVGMSASQTLSTKKDMVAASFLGFFSGMAADLDIVIRSPDDPLLFLEFHRQFTHSIIFMPVGGLICATIFWFLLHYIFKNHALTFGRTYLYSTAGYVTHGLLDSCTSYGTQLFWPFSVERIAWNNVSIIDPLFTLPLLAIALFAMTKRSQYLGYLGAAFAISYLSLGVIQEHRIKTVAKTLADGRGHDAINLNVKPSFANLIVWKSIYEHQGRYYVDAIRIIKSTRIYQGDSTLKLDVGRDLAWLDKASQQAIDIERFRWFSADYLALDSNNPYRIIDMRYSILPNRLDGLWGIELSPNASQTDHVTWTANRNADNRTENIYTLWEMIKGQGGRRLPSKY
ncbi:MAG: inner membrane protein [Methylophagaceae bacterium]|jgi:inner membrane protein